MKAKKSSKSSVQSRSISAFEANITRHEIAALNATTEEERDAMMARVEATRRKLQAFKRTH